MRFIPECSFLAVLLLWGCAGLITDSSIPAVDAGDYTLAMSACENTPGGGFDICRVVAGAPIQSSWKLVIPKSKFIESWEVDVFYRDVAQSVHIEGKAPLVEIPWSSFFKANTWDTSMNGEALALLTVSYREETGILKKVAFKGLAKIVVLAPGYTRLPIDSGAITWGANCKIRYTTSGRGAVECK